MGSSSRAFPTPRHPSPSAPLIGEQPENCRKKCYLYWNLDWIVKGSGLAGACKRVEGHPKTAPEVIFKVVSLSTAFKDERVKKDLYGRKGV
ncbi:MAG: hypothetical protein GXO08_00685 [Aquificae bacterium]|nr:hypothetical protein [Aquificota bacterium]